MLTAINLNVSCNQKANVSVGNKKIYKPRIIAAAPTNESTVILTKNGTLKIFFVNRPGDANNMMSISSNDGITWTSPEKEFDLPGQAYYANQVCVDRNGTLHCVFHIQASGNKGYRGRHYDLWYCQKELNKKWTDPAKIFTGYVGSIRNFFQLKSGRLLMAFGKANTARSEKPKNGETDYGWNEIVALYSDDLGQSWNLSQNTLKVVIDSEKKTRYGAIEPDVIQMKDGSLWMLIRTNKGVLYQSFSIDDGKNWSEPEPTKFISSDSPAKLLRLTDGRIIVFLNMNQRWDDPNSYAFGGREVLHAAISNDEGKTWEGFREVMRVQEELTLEKGDRGTAYPSAVETADGKILLVSGQGQGKLIVVFDPDWLEQDRILKNAPIVPCEWTMYGLTGKLSKEYFKKDNKIRFFARPDISQKRELVWNFPATTAGKLMMDIEFIDTCSILDLYFTDHFSVSVDSMAKEHSIFNFVIDNTFKKGEKLPVCITWNTIEQNAELYLFNKKVSETGINRIPVFGINYIRISFPATNCSQQSGFLLNSVSVNEKRNL